MDAFSGWVGVCVWITQGEEKQISCSLLRKDMNGGADADTEQEQRRNKSTWPRERQADRERKEHRDLERD